MSERPPIRCYATGHVVQAVSVQLLAAGMKDTWHIVHRFDRRPTGCELSAGILAEKIGMSVHTVRHYIEALVALGLLVRLNLGGLAATVPDECVPSSNRPGWQEVQRLAKVLEVRIRARGGFASESEVTGPTGSHPRAKIPSQTSAKSLVPEGEPLEAVGAVGVTTPAGEDAIEALQGEERRVSNGLPEKFSVLLEKYAPMFTKNRSRAADSQSSARMKPAAAGGLKIALDRNLTVGEG